MSQCKRTGYRSARAVLSMIPDLPDGVSTLDSLKFYSTLAGNLSDQSSIHVNWHTHRQNPSVCWICDMNILISKILLATSDITKSSLDMETESSSDNESDSEIEDTSFNKDDEPSLYDGEVDES